MVLNMVYSMSRFCLNRSLSVVKRFFYQVQIQTIFNKFKFASVANARVNRSVGKCAFHQGFIEDTAAKRGKSEDTSPEDVPTKKPTAKVQPKRREEEELNEEALAPPLKRGRAKEKPSHTEEELTDEAEVPKKGRAAKVKESEVPKKKGKTSKEKQSKKDESSEEAEVIQKKSRAVKDKPSTSKNENVNGEGDVAQKKGRTAKASKSKKDADAEQNGTSSKSVKPKATKVKRSKEELEDDEEEPAKPQKRKAPKERSEAGSEPAAKAPKNATATDWDKIDFKCAKKNPKGKASNFHVTSWNVDGLRAWIKKGGLEILAYDDPDIFCVQETKCSEEKLPDEIQNVEGYETLWCSSEKDGYAGVGILTKVKPLSVTYGINSEEHDGEGRCITAEFPSFYLVNVYVPNAGRKLVTLPKRLEWNAIFRDYVKELNVRKPVIVCGDMNVSHAEIDLANPKTNKKNAGFTVEEREGMTEFLQDGYVDTFRKLYPDKEKAYTFWTYMSNARSKNVGWRLDYFIVPEKFMENVCDNIIHSDVLGSDHCPLSLYVNI